MLKLGYNKISMNNAIKIYAYFLVLLLIAGNTNIKANIKTIFQVALPAESVIKSQEQKNAFFDKAMSIIINRLTGISSTEQQQKLKPAIKNVKNYILSYSYNNISTTSKSGNTNAAFIVNFDEKAVVTFLKNNNYSAWITSRPRILVWTDFKQTNFNLSNTELGQLKKTFIADFSMLDISASYPVMDFQDLKYIAKKDKDNTTNKKFMTRVLQRYNSDIMVFVQASLVSSDDNYTGSIIISFKNKFYNKSFENLSMENLSDLTVNFTNKLMANYYNSNQQKDKKNYLILQIYKINDTKTYCEIYEHLKNISNVVSVTPLSIYPNYITFKLNIRGDKLLTESILNIDPYLTAIQTTQDVEVESTNSIKQYYFNQEQDTKKYNTKDIYRFKWIK